MADTGDSTTTTTSTGRATAVHVEAHQHEELVFEPPGPGSWTLDKGHIPRPCTRFSAEVVPDAFRAGFLEVFTRYGIPAAGMEQALINGFSYGQLTPLAGPDFEARMAEAEAAVATKRWRLDLERWDTEAKPASIRRHRELIDVDVDLLVITELIGHLRDCRTHVVEMIVQHHRFNGAAMIPLGDLLASVEEWTDGSVTSAEVMPLFAGASPISRGDCPELRAVSRAIRADMRARSIVEDAGADPAESLDRLRNEKQVEWATTIAVGEWLSLVGNRILDGFDVHQPRAIERPAVLVACLRDAISDREAARTTSAPDAAVVRDRIPLEHRDAFDERYEEARLTYRLRDERGVYSDATALGIMRRAMLAAGARLAAVGQLAYAELAIEAGIDELVALLDEHPSAPTVDELRARARFRAAYTAADAPSLLGDPPGPPPPLEMLPPAMARMTRAMIATSSKMDAEPVPAPPGSDRCLTGVAASPGRHEGVARIVHTVDDLERVEDGDVIVAITTAESFNLAMSFAAAVVTDQGGLLGHAAITAREYGIPAVVGTQRATTTIVEGTRIVVDGSTGEVTW